MPSFKSWLLAHRTKLRKGYIKSRLTRNNVSFISEDCWSGKAYQDLGLKCLSPFIGMGVRRAHYLSFLTHMREPGALDPLSISSQERGYPIIQTRYADLMGMHYKSEQECMQRYERRRSLIDWDNLFIKIDLGKPQFTRDDITRWNEMKLPRSVAFYPDEPFFHSANIHNGVCVTDWIDDGDLLFQRSCRNFDIIKWLNHGVIKKSRLRSLIFYILYTGKAASQNPLPRTP